MARRRSSITHFLLAERDAEEGKTPPEEGEAEIASRCSFPKRRRAAKDVGEDLRTEERMKAAQGQIFFFFLIKAYHFGYFLGMKSFC